MEGWIKLHKKIKEHWMWDDPVILKAWLDILLSVNYTEKKILFDSKLITIKAGQIITSVRKLADRWKCSKERVNKILGLFVQDGMLTVDKTVRRTLLSVVNYELYQNGYDTNKDTEKDIIKDTQMDTEKDTDSPQHKNNKEDKKDKEVKNNKKSSRFAPPSLDEVREYCIERHNKVNPERFINFYEAKGWMVGKNKMKDWKAAIRTWEQRDSDQAKPVPKGKDYSQRDYSDDTFKSLELKKLKGG